MTSVLEQRYRVRRQGLSTGKTMLGRAVFHTIARPTDRAFDHHQLRMREIEVIIAARHGAIVPDPEGTDDRETCLDYARAVAASLSKQNLHQWAHRWMPWASSQELDEITRAVGWRKYMMGADQAAKLLAVTLAERTALDLKTVGACDVDKAERQAIARDAKRRRDRERQASRRRAAGRIDRQSYEASSAEATKPWLAEGVSRRTWYRRQAGTSVSRVDKEHTIGDRPVPRSPEASAGERTARPVTLDIEASAITTASFLSPHTLDATVFGEPTGLAPGPNATLRAGASNAGSGPHRSDDTASEEAA